MKRELKESFGVWILLMYFIKWPYALGFPYLYFEKGLQDNWFMNLFWVFCVVLIIKDLIYFIRYGWRCDPKNGCESKKKD